MPSKLSLLFIFASLFSGVFGQNIGVGQWRSHLNYTDAIKCEEVKDKIFCATQNGLFYASKTGWDITRLSKTDGFADVQISTICYDKANDLLMIAYQSTNIDLVKGNQIINVPDIFRKYIPGLKSINHINFNDNKAYLSCSFGIVVYDELKNEIKETYSDIGENGAQLEIFATAILDDSIYAATANGILSASLSSPNLLDYKAWHFITKKDCRKISSFNQKIYALQDGFLKVRDGNNWTLFIDSLQNTLKDIVVSNDHLVVTFENYIFIEDNTGTIEFKKEYNLKSAILDSEGKIWVAVPYYSLLRIDQSGTNFFSPNGPSTKLNWTMEAANDVIWVAAGGLTYTGSSTYNSDGIYYFEEGSWKNKNFRTTQNFNKLADILNIAIDPVTGHVFLGSFGNGLAEYYNGDIQTFYDKSNSKLGGSTIGDSNRITIRGLCYDNKNSLWISCYAAENQLVEKKQNGTWKSYNLGSGTNRNVGEIVIDDENQKWILLPTDGEILVFDETKPAGANYKKLTNVAGRGNLPSVNVYSIAKDLDGRIWIGTDAGIAVFYDPSAVFSGRNYDAQRVWVTYQGVNGYLLDAEVVTCITVDGANNKWLGTRNGVWYVSSDGSTVIYNFTTKNSPLPSDYIRDIAIDPKTGEVFFGTDNGIVSLRNFSTTGGNLFEDVVVFPNPVRPDYNGLISIKGLARDANVKITDIAGNLVFETTAQGGQAVWDGNNFSGQEACSGVYLVFCSNEEGTETFITKLLIVR